MSRCSWVGSDEIYIKYHDNEWGVPVYDDKLLFEMLILESFHTGLSWLIILKKRENFRKAFDNFDSQIIVHYGEDKIEELLNNPGIVRSRRKIEATIGNTRVYHNIQKEFGSFSNYLWGFNNNKITYNKDDSFMTTTELSDRVSKDLKKRGMKYVGSVTINAYLEAVGVLNNHHTSCFRYKKCQ